MSKKLQPLFEAIPFEILEMKEVDVLENGQTVKRFRVKGIFNRADERNSNNRIYPSRIVEREHRKLNERLSNDTVFMQADHPTDGVSRIADTTALMKSVAYDTGTKLVTGEADILPTHKGKDLQEIIRAGGKVGISARGFGTTSPGEVAGQKGDVVNEDYQLVTYDFVVGQSTRGAVVTNFAEQARLLAGLTEEKDMDFQTLSLDALKAARPDLVTSIENAVKEAAKTEAEKAVATIVAEKTDEIEERLRKELKLEKKKDDEEDDDETNEMIASAHRLGFRLEATDPGESRYGGGKGRKGRGEEKSDASDAEDQEDTDAPDYQDNSGKGAKSEQEVLAWARKHGLKLEKKKKEDDGDGDMEERFNNVNAQLRDAKVIIEQTQKQTKELTERLLQGDIRAYIFDKCKDVKHVKNALIERLLAANLKSKDEVDAQIPVIKASIEQLLMEASGGKGIVVKDEPIGDDAKKLQVKINGQPVVLTESEFRQRNLAGLSTELVEQAK